MYMLLHAKCCIIIIFWPIISIFWPIISTTIKFFYSFWEQRCCFCNALCRFYHRHISVAQFGAPLYNKLCYYQDRPNNCQGYIWKQLVLTKYCRIIFTQRKAAYGHIPALWYGGYTNAKRNSDIVTLLIKVRIIYFKLLPV